jgi:GDP-L-fucose synthase
MVGSAIWRKLESEGYENLIGESSQSLDLRDQSSVFTWFEKERPEIVVDAAARVGGILANNNYPYQFLMDNLMIQNNLIQAAEKYDCKKFIFLGSSCIYPKLADQPIHESSLLTGPLEPTNEWYAIAKITGVKACEAIRKQYGKDFVSLMPTNLYGPFDNFDLETSHVLPALIRKFHEAAVSGKSTVELWGDGSPMREFLYVEDLADAVYFAMQNTLDDNLYNVGTGSDLTIKELADKIAVLTGFKGEIVWDSSKPNGTPRKLLDVSKMADMGWTFSTSLDDGLAKTYQ